MDLNDPLTPKFHTLTCEAQNNDWTGEAKLLQLSTLLIGGKNMVNITGVSRVV